MSAEIHQLEAHDRSDSGKYRVLITNIRKCLNEHLSARLAHMFDTADETLFQLAESAKTNEDQTRYFDTMRLLRLERTNIGEYFDESLRKHLRAGEDAETSDTQEEELSLIDQDEMEELVAISTMHSSVMNNSGDAVNHLEARLEALARKAPGIINHTALNPKNICEAFQQSLAHIEINNKNKLIIYRLFDQHVCAELGELYQALNNLLIDEGILPQIKLDHSTDRQSKNSGSTQNVITSPESNNSENSPHAEISRVVGQFISGEIIASGPGIPLSFATPALAPDNNTKGIYYDRRDVLRALSNLQSNFIQQNEVTEFVDAETFKRALMIDMGSRHGGTLTKRVNQIDEKTIDFIEMLFEVIVEDNSISDIVTNLLLRLQIPVIKAAMLDLQFFSSSEHPARKLLNLIPQAGTGISDRTDQAYIRLEHIIDRLLEEFDVDITSFQRAVDQLNALINLEKKISEDNEKHTQKQVLQEHARLVVLTELHHLVAHKVLPSAAHPLVLKHWATLMLQRYIQSGKAGEEWKQANSLLRQLINSLQPITSKAQWQHLNTTYIDLIDTIKGALYDTNQNKININESLVKLMETYQALLDESEYRPFNMQPDETGDTIILDDTAAFDALPEVAVELIDPSPLEEQAEEAREKISRLPAEVRPGTWFAIFDGEDQPLRHLKLSVIIMEEARLVFVDRQGKKVLEKDADLFTTELSNGQSSQITDHPVFDHALNRVIDCLSAAS